MQLIHLPRLRHVTQLEARALETLPLFSAGWSSSSYPKQQQALVEQLFVLFYGLEKQLVPYFSKMTREEFDWIDWAASPELAELLVTRFGQLPSYSLADTETLDLAIDSLPQALGSAWALVHLGSQLACWSEAKMVKGPDSRILEQLETLAQIYCVSPADILAAQQAARLTLIRLHQVLQAWGSSSWALDASA